MNIKEILASVSSGDSTSALNAFSRLEKQDPVLAKAVEETFNKMDQRIKSQTRLITKLYEKADGCVPRIEHLLEASILDFRTAQQASTMYDTNWFSRLGVSNSALQNIASLLVQLCKPYKVTNSLWESISSGDAETINSLH
jgi:hypothetical protein